MKNKVAAGNHFLLCKYVRQENSWSIPYSLEKALEELGIIPDSPTTLGQALSNCRQFWSSTLDPQVDSHRQNLPKRKLREGLTGKVALGPLDRPFCFILME